MVLASIPIVFFISRNEKPTDKTMSNIKIEYLNHKMGILRTEDDTNINAIINTNSTTVLTRGEMLYFLLARKIYNSNWERTSTAYAIPRPVRPKNLYRTIKTGMKNVLKKTDVQRYSLDSRLTMNKYPKQLETTDTTIPIIAMSV